MKLLKTVFAIFGAIATIFIIFFIGWISGVSSYSKLSKENKMFAYEIIDKILTYQKVIEQLDNGNIDSTRFLLTDLQDKVIIDLYPDSKRLKDDRFEGNVLITLNKVGRHRKTFSSYYYPNGKELIPANSKVNELIINSLNDTMSNRINQTKVIESQK